MATITRERVRLEPRRTTRKRATLRPFSLPRRIPADRLVRPKVVKTTESDGLAGRPSREVRHLHFSSLGIPLQSSQPAIRLLISTWRHWPICANYTNSNSIQPDGPASFLLTIRPPVRLSRRQTSHHLHLVAVHPEHRQCPVQAEWSVRISNPVLPPSSGGFWLRPVSINKDCLRQLPSPPTVSRQVHMKPICMCAAS